MTTTAEITVTANQNMATITGSPDVEIDEDGELQIYPVGAARGAVVLFMSIDDWRVLNDAVETTVAEHSRLHGTATVSLAELTSTDSEGFLDLLSERAFTDDSYRAVGLDYQIVGHTADGVTLKVAANIDPRASE